MPSNKNLETVKNLTEKLDKAHAIYFTDYLGLDVVSITKLRKEFVSKDVEFTIAKNTLIKLATRERETIGIFQGGYADGVSTVLNNCGLMKINNQLFTIRGKVSMDLTAVDISNSDIKINDYGIIWGKDELLLENISKTHGKMPYEFLVNLSDRVERKYIV